MPYKSMKQMRFMHSQHPQIAKKWDKEYGSTKKYPNSLKLTMSQMAHKKRSK